MVNKNARTDVYLNTRTNHVQAPLSDFPGKQVSVTLFIQLELSEGHSLRFIKSNYFPMASIASIARAGRGILPKGTKARRALGLPALALVEGCQKCGAVHVSKTCRAGAPQTRAPRMAVSRVDARRAAATVAKFAEFDLQEFINELLIRKDEQ